MLIQLQSNYIENLVSISKVASVKGRTSKRHLTMTSIFAAKTVEFDTCLRTFTCLSERRNIFFPEIMDSPGVLLVSCTDFPLLANWTNLGILHSTGTKKGFTNKKL